MMSHQAFRTETVTIHFSRMFISHTHNTHAQSLSVYKWFCTSQDELDFEGHRQQQQQQAWGDQCDLWDQTIPDLNAQARSNPVSLLIAKHIANFKPLFPDAHNSERRDKLSLFTKQTNERQPMINSADF